MKMNEKIQLNACMFDMKNAPLMRPVAQVGIILTAKNVKIVFEGSFGIILVFTLRLNSRTQETRLNDYFRALG